MLAVDEIAVFGHVARRIHQVLHVAEEPLVLARQFLPGLLQPGHGAVTQSGDDVEHGIEVLALFALARHFDELLDGSHPPHQVVLGAHFRHHPKHFAIDQLSKQKIDRKIDQ